MNDAGVVAVDVGTSLIKAVVFDASGAELVITQHPTRVLLPGGGRSEQDMHEVLAAVLDCITRAAARSPIPVAALAITAQGDGAWLVDERGAPVGNAVLWNDARATDIVQQWTSDGTMERAYRSNGSLGNLGLPNSILRWMQVHDTDAVIRTASVLTCGSWLYLALTGRTGLHPSDASAPWLDIETGAVSPALLEVYGLTDLADRIPPVLAPDELTAPLRPELASEIGLPAGTPVTLAPYDVVATAVGGGAITAGDAYCILGTTLCTGVLLASPDTSGPPTGLTLRNERGGPVIRAFPTLAGTGVIDWLATLLGLQNASEVTALAAGSRPGAGGVRVWPYLSPAGERTPFLDTAARGVIGGLAFGADRADLARATIEGLAHVIRDCLNVSGAEPEVLVLAGGGSASTLWCQTIADVTGVPTARATGEQVGARGAMLATGTFDGIEDSASGNSRTTYKPNSELRALFDDRHDDFVVSRAALAERWPSWAAGAVT